MPPLPPANGPFRLVSQQPGHWTLVKNDRYWDASHVALSGLDLKFDDDATKVTRSFKEGALDWVADGIDGSAPLGAQYFSANALFGTSFFYFKTDKAPWTDARVRKALILLLPLEDLRKPYLEPTSVLIPQFKGILKSSASRNPTLTKPWRSWPKRATPAAKGFPS